MNCRVTVLSEDKNIDIRRGSKKKENTIEASQKWRNWEKITLLKTGLLRRRNDQGRAEYRPRSLEKADR